MPRTKIDRRIVKTKRAINVALLQLLDTKEPEEITITELTTCADINRKTFYLHYTCIKDVAAELQRNLRLATLDIIDSSRNADGAFSPAALLAKVQERIAANPDFFRALCLKGTWEYFTRTVGECAVDRLLGFYRDGNLSGTAALRLAVIGMLAGTAQFYLEWSKSPSGLSLGEVTELAACFAEQASALLTGVGAE